MQRDDPIPDNKQCETCGSALKWWMHGSNEIDAPESMREGIFRCPKGCETWTYMPRRREWRKH